MNPNHEQETMRGGSDAQPSFPCAVCGREFVPDAAHRCETCRRFACRDCLKILYHHDARGNAIPSRTLCYHCFHEEFTEKQ